MITDKLLKLLGFLRFDIRENAWPGSNGSRTSWRSPGWRSRRVGNNSSQTNLAGCTAASPHLWKKKFKGGYLLICQKAYLSSILLARSSAPRQTKYNCGSYMQWMDKSLLVLWTNIYLNIVAIHEQIDYPEREVKSGATQTQFSGNLKI